MLRRAAILSRRFSNTPQNFQNLPSPSNDGTGGVDNESGLEHTDINKPMFDENEAHPDKKAGKCRDCKNPSCKLSGVIASLTTKTKEVAVDQELEEDPLEEMLERKFRKLNPLERLKSSLGENGREF